MPLLWLIRTDLRRGLQLLWLLYRGRLLFLFGGQIPSDSGYGVNSFFTGVIVDLTDWARNYLILIDRISNKIKFGVMFSE